MELALLCAKIFLGRLVDVSLSTMQTMYLVKGKRSLATIIGFIDVLIWFMVVKEALNTDIQSFWIALAYAGGYAVGTYVGSGISKRVIRGTVSVQVITKNAQIDNRKLKDFKNMITALDENAFITVTENKEILNGYFGK